VNSVQELLEKKMIETLDLDKIVDSVIPEIDSKLQERMKKGVEEAIGQCIDEIDMAYLFERMDLEDMVYDKLGARLKTAFNKAFDIMDGNVLNDDHRELLGTLKTNLAYMPFSCRVKKVLKEAELEYIGDLFRVRGIGKALLSFRNFGRKCLKEVDERLKEYGLSVDTHIPAEVLLEYADFKANKNN
jgi:hypothetical protein